VQCPIKNSKILPWYLKLLNKNEYIIKIRSKCKYTRNIETTTVNKLTLYILVLLINW